MEQLEAQLDKLAEGDILILAGSIPSSLPQTTYERLLARLEGHGVHTVCLLYTSYLACTTGEVSTDSFYWVSRMIAAMADASTISSLYSK